MKPDIHIDNWYITRNSRHAILTSKYVDGPYYDFHHYHFSSQFSQNVFTQSSVNSKEIEEPIRCGVCYEYIQPREIKKLLLMTP